MITMTAEHTAVKMAPMTVNPAVPAPDSTGDWRLKAINPNAPGSAAEYICSSAIQQLSAIALFTWSRISSKAKCSCTMQLAKIWNFIGGSNTGKTCCLKGNAPAAVMKFSGIRSCRKIPPFGAIFTPNFCRWNCS